MRWLSLPQQNQDGSLWLLEVTGHGTLPRRGVLERVLLRHIPAARLEDMSALGAHIRLPAAELLGARNAIVRDFRVLA